jgi:hypothetical protein
MGTVMNADLANIKLAEHRKDVQVRFSDGRVFRDLPDVSRIVHAQSAELELDARCRRRCEREGSGFT